MKLKIHEKSLFAILARSPWWVSVAIAAGVVLGSRLFLPDAYAVAVGLPFLVVAAVALWRQLRAPSPSRVAGTLEAIGAMSWAEFSGALAAAFGREGYEVTRLDGAQADFELARAGRRTVVGCKRWKAARTGVEPLRELDAARRAREASEAIYVATGEVSDNAVKFAAANGIRVLRGADLAALFAKR
ncbi:MAG: restriction endonuclease [Burkholderiales bacterium]|nr:restriction endonuclease [Burkholderiales bacterium]